MKNAPSKIVSPKIELERDRQLSQFLFEHKLVPKPADFKAQNKALWSLIYFLAKDKVQAYSSRFLEIFLDVMTKELQKKKAKSLAAIIIDIKDLRGINRSFGHHGGDQYLNHFSKRLSQFIRTQRGDWGFRWGGDEFVAFLENVSKKKTELIISRLRKDINKLPAKLQPLDGGNAKSVPYLLHISWRMIRNTGDFLKVVAELSNAKQR